MKTLTPKFKIRWQWIQAGFWLGPILIALGLAIALVSGSWGPLPLGCLIAGGGVLSLWLLVQTRGISGIWGYRSTQASTNALLATLAMVTILGLLNFVAVRYPSRWDLTEQQFFSLSPQTQEVLQNLPQPVKVLVFNPQPEPASRTLLEQYQRQGTPNFTFEFIDPQAQPGLAQKYKIRNAGDVVLESDKRTLPLEQRLTEANLTPAIARVVSNRQSHAYIIQGHGEASLEPGQESLSEAVQALTDKSINVLPLNLLESPKIPENADVIVIPGPKRSFLEAEVQLLQDYLQQGGNLLLMLEPETQPKLDKLLQDWGITLDNRLVVDASGAGQLIGLGPAFPLVTRYGNSPITKDFAQGVSFYPLAQAVQVQEKPNQQVTELLFTSEQSWAESDPDSPELTFDPQRDRQGPLVLGVKIVRSLDPAPKANPPQAQPQPKQARLIVIGDANFATDGSFGQGLNGDLFLNAVTWLSDRPDQVLSIRPKEATNRRLELTAQKGRLLTLLGLGILPLGAFGAAAGLWWRRR